MSDWMDLREEWARPQVEPKPWMAKKVLKLVNTEAEFEKVIDACIKSGLYALDLETEGLDTRVYNERTVHQIVGACISPDGHHGYYIPVRHREHPQHNLPVTVFERGLRRLITSAAKAIFHNGPFDQEFLQFCGADLGSMWDDPQKWEDSQILAYLSFSRMKSTSLKVLSKSVLGMEQIELSELFDPEVAKRTGYDFGTLDPTWEAVTWYGAADAICTYLLYKRYIDLIMTGKGEFGWPKFEEKGTDWPKPHGGHQQVIYAIEKLTVPATRWMQRNRIPIDRPKVAELIAVSHREWVECFNDVYTQVSEALGRDVRPGKVKLFMDPTEKDWFFKVNEPVPTTTDHLDMCAMEAARRDMDPTMRDDRGKLQIQAIPKELPMVTDPKKKETVLCPLVYDINAPVQLGLMFRELAVPGLKVTENSGQVSTKAEELERVIEETGDKFAFMAAIKRFRNIHKALSNLYPIFTDSDLRDDTLYVQFKQLGTDTGRYTTPGRKKGKPKQGGTTWNLHSTPATYDPNRPEGMRRIREVIKARPGRKIVAIDFSGVELRIVTNLSREPEWLNEFFRCSTCTRTFDRGNGQETPEAPPARCPNCGSDKIGDLHSLTAINVFGEGIRNSPEFKQKRQEAKSANFALCYGGSGNAVMRATGCDKNEGFRIKTQFDKKYKVLSRWWSGQHRFARAHGYVTTAMGRWYPCPDIDHSNGFFRSKAERNTVNGPVQGGSADITKLSMAMIYRKVKELDWLDKCRMIITIHDELVFEIDDDILGDAIDMLIDVMTHVAHRLKWPVPLTVDCEIGLDWTVPWDLNGMRYREVRYIGDKKYKSPDKLPEGYVWDALPSWPDSLINLFSEAQRNPPSAVVAESAGPLSSEPSAFERPEVREAIVEAARKQGNPNAVVGGGPLVDMPNLERGSVVTHQVSQSNLSVGMMFTLAEVITKCRGGSNPLRIVIRETGEALWDGPEVLVDANMFVVLANAEGV